jgi:hypothetical protein
LVCQKRFGGLKIKDTLVEKHKQQEASLDEQLLA